MEAVFGAGCFWHVEELFRKIPGVMNTTVGYLGGAMENPSYEDVCRGNTGHAEVVHIDYDETQITFDELLQVFWNNHNPTTLNRQGPDVGEQYRSAIFYYNEEQKQNAEKSKKDIEQSNKYKDPIVTQIVRATMFYLAEEYHQKYFKKCGLSHE